MPRWDGRTPDDRFWYRVDNTGECWIWTGAKYAGKGYGVCKRDGKNLRAHRVAWEMVHGPVPAGMFVCHRCDNPACVREPHLFLGTNSDNVADRDAKGRQARGDRQGFRLHPELVARGERHWKAKLTATDVLRIRELKKQGMSYAALMEMFGVSEGCLQKIVLRASWAHL